MYEVVVARVRLEDEDRIRRAGVWTRAIVEIHRGEAFELARDDVVPPEFRIADEISVELVRLGAAEIPAFSSRVAEDTGLGKQRPEVLHLIGRLVVRDQRRTWAAGTTIEPEKDQHLGAANVVVDVPPVRIADVRKAVGAAAVVSVRQSNRRRAVRRRKLEDALRFVRRKESEYLIASEASPEDLRSGFLEKAAIRRLIGSRNDVAMAVQQPFTQLPGVGVEPKHIGEPVAVEVSHADDVPRRGTSGAAGHGKNGSRHDVALAVQQPFTQLPGVGVEPEHIGEPVAVEVSDAADVPRRGTAGAAGHGKNGSRHDVALAVQQPFTQLPGVGV